MNTIEVPLANLEKFFSKLAKLQKKAARNNAGEINATKLDQTSRSVTFAIDAPTVIHKTGWNLHGVVDWTHDEPVLRTVANTGCESTFINERFHCDHCNTTRYRTETFIIEKNGTRREVGRTCLKDFLDEGDVSRILERATLIREIDEFCADHEFDDLRNNPSHFDLNSTLVSTAAVIRNYGWVSVTSARESEDELTATRDLVADPDTMKKIKIEEADRETAQNAIEWAASTTADTDYLNAIRIIAKDGWCSRKELGIAASMVSAYHNEQRKQAVKELSENLMKGAAQVPQADDRIHVVGTIVKRDRKETAYGLRELMTVLDDRGFKLWGGCPEAINEASEGDRVSFFARVTKSDTDDTFGFFKRPTKVKIEEEDA